MTQTKVSEKETKKKKEMLLERIWCRIKVKSNSVTCTFDGGSGFAGNPLQF